MDNVKQDESSESPRDPPTQEELIWRAREDVCPMCGNAMALVNGFYRCRVCGYKESCCWV